MVIKEEDFAKNKMWEEKAADLCEEIKELCAEALDAGMPFVETLKAVAYTLQDGIENSTKIYNDRLCLLKWVTKMIVTDMEEGKGWQGWRH